MHGSERPRAEGRLGRARAGGRVDPRSAAGLPSLELDLAAATARAGADGAAPHVRHDDARRGFARGISRASSMACSSGGLHLFRKLLHGFLERRLASMSKPSGRTPAGVGSWSLAREERGAARIQASRRW